MKNKNGCLGIFIIIIIIVVAFFTNPSFENHVNKIDIEYDKVNPITGILVGPIVIKQVTTYNDYYVFSTTTCNGHLLSIGAFTKVGVVMDLDIYSNEIANCFLGK